MSASTDRTAAARAARAHASQDKRRRAVAAVAKLESAGAPVTAAAVASAAGVSTWLVYADGVREHVDAARRRQTEHSTIPACSSAHEEPTTLASLRTDLTIARQQISQLRAERDKLRRRLRLQLGAEIDGPDRAELITRVADLEGVNRQLVAERDARTAEAHVSSRRIRELEDDLAAARESLRRVIKEQNR
jgi:hypothetical protein